MNTVPEFIMVPEDENRPGHDIRYGLDDTKIKESGWDCPHTFEQSLKNTVKWTLNNERWTNM